MTREELLSAGERVESAAETATDANASERLAGLADQLEALAERDSSPDHGRLARIENALIEVRDSVGSDAADCIDAARDHITAFRETIEGV